MRIFLIRHGESLGNVDSKYYKLMGDHAITLTPFGHRQAEDAGAFLKKYYDGRPDLAGKKIRVWHSPFTRTAQTAESLLSGMGMDRVESVREDYALREQDFGLFSDIPDEKTQKKMFPHEFNRYASSRNSGGTFYARPPQGESRADVALRVRIFKHSMMRDLERGHEDVVIVAHGVTNRAIEMDFLHKTVDWFNKEPNPANCDIVLIEGSRQDGYTSKRIHQGKKASLAPTPVIAQPAPKKPPAKRGRQP